VVRAGVIGPSCYALWPSFRALKTGLPRADVAARFRGDALSHRTDAIVRTVDNGYRTLKRLFGISVGRTVQESR